MNFLSTSIQNKNLIFCAKKKQPDFPAKIPLTETEQKFDAVLNDLHSLESDIYVQKQNLRDLYSAQDRYDYKELLKKRRYIITKLNRMAKSEAKEYYEIGYEIDVKKQYNRFAPKLLRAKTKEELNSAIEIISSHFLYKKVKDMLAQIISHKNF